MKMLIHALFPIDLDPQAHEAFDALRRDGLTDPSFDHVCAYNALEHTPDFHRSALVPYALGGMAALSVVGAITGATLGALGVGGIPADIGALLGFLGFGALGGFASALGGIGAPDPGLHHAARNLREGRMLMTLAINESRLAPQVERVLENFGALETHRQLR